jgi:hypothetical protein
MSVKLKVKKMNLTKKAGMAFALAAALFGGSGCGSTGSSTRGAGPGQGSYAVNTKDSENFDEHGEWQKTHSKGHLRIGESYEHVFRVDTAGTRIAAYLETVKAVHNSMVQNLDKSTERQQKLGAYPGHVDKDRDESNRRYDQKFGESNRRFDAERADRKEAAQQQLDLEKKLKAIEELREEVRKHTEELRKANENYKGKDGKPL